MEYENYTSSFTGEQIDNFITSTTSSISAIQNYLTNNQTISFTITLNSANWSNNSQTVSNNNFVSSGYSYIITPEGSSLQDYGEAQIYANNVTTNGQITFHCVNTPSSNLTVNIMRVVSA